MPKTIALIQKLDIDKFKLFYRQINPDFAERLPYLN